MTDYSAHSTNDIEVIIKLSEKHGDRFRAYLNKVYGTLLAIPEGGYFNIEEKIQPNIVPQFMKVASLFLMEQPNYTINSTHTIITHKLRKTKYNPTWLERSKENQNEKTK